MGNTSSQIELPRFGVIANVEENRSVSGRAWIGHDFGPHVSASVGVEIDSKRNIFPSVNGSYEKGSMKYGAKVSMDQNARPSISFSIERI